MGAQENPNSTTLQEVLVVCNLSIAAHRKGFEGNKLSTKIAH